VKVKNIRLQKRKSEIYQKQQPTILNINHIKIDDFFVTFYRFIFIKY